MPAWAIVKQLSVRQPTEIGCADFWQLRGCSYSVQAARCCVVKMQGYVLLGKRGACVERQTWLIRIALRCCDWSERWFPDAYVFAALGVVIVGLLAIGIGVSPAATAIAFGDGFWSLIPFTMQMCFIIIGGYVVATSPLVARIRDAGEVAAKRARCGGFCGADEHAGLVASLGLEPDLLWFAGAPPRTA